MIDKEKLNEILLINQLIKDEDFFTIIQKIIPILRNIISEINEFSINVETQLPYYYDEHESDYNIEWEIKDIEVKLKNIGENYSFEKSYTNEEKIIKDILFEYYNYSSVFDIDCCIERKSMTDNDFIDKILETLISDHSMTDRIKKSALNKSDNVSTGFIFTKEAKEKHISDINVLLKNEYCDLFYKIIQDYKSAPLKSLNIYYDILNIHFENQTSGLDVHHFNDPKSKKLIKESWPDQYPIIEKFLNHRNYLIRLNEISNFDFLQTIASYHSGFNFEFKAKDDENMINTVDSAFKAKHIFVQYIMEKEKESLLKNIEQSSIPSLEKVNKKRM